MKPLVIVILVGNLELKFDAKYVGAGNPGRAYGEASTLGEKLASLLGGEYMYTEEKED